MNLCGWMGFSVDFQREVQGGDIFEIIYERTIDELDGREISNGKLHYAGILLSGEPQGFYRFEAAGQPTGWYDAEGQSAVRTLMRTPVSGARLSSSYGMRRHPITGYNALHRGVDFAVPTEPRYWQPVRPGRNWLAGMGAMAAIFVSGITALTGRPMPISRAMPGGFAPERWWNRAK